MSPKERIIVVAEGPTCFANVFRPPLPAHKELDIFGTGLNPDSITRNDADDIVRLTYKRDREDTVVAHMNKVHFMANQVGYTVQPEPVSIQENLEHDQSHPVRH